MNQLENLERFEGRDAIVGNMFGVHKTNVKSGKMLDSVRLI